MDTGKSKLLSSVRVAVTTMGDRFISTGGEISRSGVDFASALVGRLGFTGSSAKPEEQKKAASAARSILLQVNISLSQSKYCYYSVNPELKRVRKCNFINDRINTDAIAFSTGAHYKAAYR